MNSRSVHIVMSGASATPEPVSSLVRLLSREEWDVGTIVSTPTGLRFHDAEELELITGSPVYVDFRRPGTGKRVERPDVILACPWSFNSTNKTVSGIADTFAVALVCEMIGARVPAVIVPSVNPPLSDHPAFPASVAALRAMPSVTVLHKPTAKTPSWGEVLAAVEAAGNS